MWGEDWRDFAKIGHKLEHREMAHYVSSIYTPSIHRNTPHPAAEEADFMFVKMCRHPLPIVSRLSISPFSSPIEPHHIIIPDFLSLKYNLSRQVW